ncbi:MAG: LuxR family transcriptional regulator, partial [Salinarimonas sp.]|nr:LuxR family transcriptional regulator [Salinarimonas sp.]
MFSVSFYIFTHIKLESLSSPHVTTLSNAQTWKDSYDESKLRSNDPLLRYIASSTIPATWSHLRIQPAYSDRLSLSAFDHASSHGLTDGVTIPCRSCDGYAGLSFAGPEMCDDGLRDHLSLYGPILANHLLENFRRVSASASSPSQATADHLTGREAECLLWAGEGKTAWEISQILAIAERTVVFHLTNATSKLKASSRQHAVSKAILSGVLRPRV